MRHKPNRELIAAVAAAVDEISEGDGVRWWPGADIAPIAYRRWRSFDRRNNAKAPTHEQRVLDLVKGLQSHFEPDIPSTHVSDWHSLAEPLADILDNGINAR